jgi:hypothetical protein
MTLKELIEFFPKDSFLNIELKRDKNDIFGMPLLNIIFKNRVFQRVVQILVLGFFVYAIFFGFIHPTKEENLFTTGLFWGLFWPVFMVTTLSTFGRIFCGVCPHGFIGKYITKIGLKRKNTPINGFCKKFGSFLFKPIFVIYLPINPCGQTPQKILPKVLRVVTIKTGQNNPQNRPVVNRFSSFVGCINPKKIA